MSPAINKKFKSYELTLWPNNQPPVLLGYCLAESKRKAQQKALDQHKLKKSDPVQITLDGPKTPYKQWLAQA